MIPSRFRASGFVSVLSAIALLTSQSYANPTSEPVTTPAVSYAAAYRFLEQASWGPTADSIAHVQQIGFNAYIDEQINVPFSTIPDVPPDAKGREPISAAQERFFYNAITGQDQLRQRVMFALGEIWVVSGVKLRDASEIVPYLRLLQQDAFANYRKIMYDVTVSPAMGHYLDMVNNDKPNSAKGISANENYAREVMQLFTIGLNDLNPDGTTKKDGSGNPIATYGQDTIEGFARAFTGWTYAPAAGTVSHKHNPPNFAAPMVAVDSNHDTDPKLVLNGTILPAGQSATKDLNDALDNIFNHPNVGPFISRQLIQHLVTSSPSPGYVQRVSSVFADNGHGVRGDMGAVVKAILLDPEARAGDASSTPAVSEHLREPVLLVNSLLRALNANVSQTNSLLNYTNNMGQNVYFPATVFNYFTPQYEIEGTTINAPEFQILSPSTAMTRADFVNALVFAHRVTGVTVDLAPYASLASTPNKLIDAVGLALLGGRVPPDVRSHVLTAVNAAATPAAKAETAIYLIATSALYQVEH